LVLLFVNPFFDHARPSLKWAIMLMKQVSSNFLAEFASAFNAVDYAVVIQYFQTPVNSCKKTAGPIAPCR